MMRPGHVFFWIGILIAGTLLNACIKDVDYDQMDDFVLSPDLELSLAYFEFLASDFDEDTNNDNSYIDSTQADLFSQDFFDQNLRAAEFTIVHINTVERAFQAEFVFKDQQGTPLYSVEVFIPPYDGNPQEVVTLIYFDESQIGILKNTFTISAKIELLPGNPPLTNSSDGAIKFQSSAIFYMQFE
ncbi:hypothetical protein [Robertkochia flava]|uniref:hypothetical protein n=1 Tax=Robertkochia flava TaxID=3447986 RepID=UPI001CCE307F|nr:hypothetical protein [Robertkochia marina]